MKCLKCGREAGADKFCKGCKNIKKKAMAIISQNKNKMGKLLLLHKYSPERFIKFNLYSDNIRDYGKVLIEFKQVETKNRFEQLLIYGIGVNCIVSCFFIFELIIIG